MNKTYNLLFLIFTLSYTCCIGSAHEEEWKVEGEADSNSTLTPLIRLPRHLVFPDQVEHIRSLYQSFIGSGYKNKHRKQADGYRRRWRRRGGRRRRYRNHRQRNKKRKSRGGYCGKGHGHVFGKIVGGHESLVTEFPWLVALFRRHGSGYAPFCGGAVINKNWILTASHCVYGQVPGNLQGMVGSTNIITKRDSTALLLSFSKIILHGSYNPTTFANDIALLRINGDLLNHLWPNSKAINTICLPQSGSNYNGFATVAGWGYQKEKGRSSNHLRSVDLELQDDQRCAGSYPAQFDNKIMFCAGVRGGGKDSCQGDSGGPLVKMTKDRSVIIGIVSYGRGCARGQYPGVYTKVSNFISWINKYAT